MKKNKILKKVKELFELYYQIYVVQSEVRHVSSTKEQQFLCLIINISILIQKEQTEEFE